MVSGWLIIVAVLFITYVAARLYDDITKQNNEYLSILNNKNEQIQNMTTQTIYRVFMSVRGIIMKDMTANRIYRKRLTNEQAMSELEKGLGTQFDFEIASALIDMLRTGAIKNLSPDMVEPNAAGQV